MKNKGNFSIGAIYNDLILGFPWILMLGVFQQSYWKFFPLKRFFSGPAFWDWFTVIDLYMIALVVVLAIGLIRKKIDYTQRKIPGFFMASTGLIFLAGILQILFQQTYEPILSTPLDYFRSLFVFPVLLAVLIYKTLPEEKVEKLVNHFLWMEGFFCFLALLQYFFGIFAGDQYDFMKRLTWPYIDHLTLKFTSANWAAFFVTPGLVISFIKVFRALKIGEGGLKKAFKKLTKSDWLNMLIFVLCLAVIYLTQSYGAYVAALVAVTTYLFRVLNFKKFLAAFLVVIVLGAGVYLLQKNSYKYQVLTGQKEYRFENSAESRKDIYMMNFEMLKKSPLLGVGLNQYQSYFAANNEKILGHKFNEVQTPAHAHNFFLGMWLSLGIFGLLGMLALVIGAMIKSRFRPENIAVFALTAMMTHGLIDSYYWKQDTAYIFWLVLIMVLIYSKAGHTSSSEGRRSPATE